MSWGYSSSQPDKRSLFFKRFKEFVSSLSQTSLKFISDRRIANTETPNPRRDMTTLAILTTISRLIPGARQHPILSLVFRQACRTYKAAEFFPIRRRSEQIQQRTWLPGRRAQPSGWRRSIIASHSRTSSAPSTGSRWTWPSSPRPRATAVSGTSPSGTEGAAQREPAHAAGAEGHGEPVKRARIEMTQTDLHVPPYRRKEAHVQM